LLAILARSTGEPHSMTPANASRWSSLWWRLRQGRGNPKHLPGGGCVIAFVGPDASGKSTMVAQSASWLGKVFPVQTAHLGKPPSTWLTWLPHLAGGLLGKLMPRMRTFHQRPTQAGAKSSGQGLLYRIRAVLLAWDRRALARRLARQAQQGWLVICDRYPTACVGAPDSARLMAPENEPGLSWLKASLARLENRLYRGIPDPGIVIRLSAPLALTIDRNRERDKPGKEGDDFVARRHSDFFMPPFGDAQIIVLDASTSQQATVDAMRRHVWQALCEPQLETHNEDHNVAPPLRISSPQFERSSPLVVEFIGATGVGKSTLIGAVMQDLAAQGLRVGRAEDVILARYGLTCSRWPKLQSALLFVLSVAPFCRHFFTRQGANLSRLAFSSILRGMSNPWVGANLVRNFIKRIGSHFLLEKMRTKIHDYDIVIWDEGVIHAAHNLFVHHGVEPNPEAIEEFGRLVPRPDVLVWVTAPIAQLVQVLLQRGHSRVGATPRAATAFTQRAQTTFAILSCVETLRDRVFRIDNSRLEDEAADSGLRARADTIREYLTEQLLQSQFSSEEGTPVCLTA
jgi:thymidylate kinase